MNKIIKLSSNGFQLNNYKWFTCDKKKIIDTGKFKLLKSGLELENIKTVVGKDKKEYVVDFDIVKHDSECDEGVSNPPKNDLNSIKSPSSIQDSIRYAQCVNIAFNNLNTQSVDLTFKKDNEEYSMIICGFDLANKIYEEWNKRG